MSDIGVVIDLDDQSIEQSKTVLDYTSRDFVAIRTQLVGLAKGLMPEWETAGEDSDFGTLILELFAYMGDVIHFYIDRTASEAFLGTAVRRQSVLYIADMMGYIPVGQQCASVMLTFTLQADDPEAPGSVIALDIPAGTRIYNSASNADDVIVFELDSAVHIEPGTSVDTYASEGISVDSYSLGSCQGVPNTEFVIPDKGVIYGTIQVVTREGYQVLTWTNVTHLASARPTQAVFVTFMDDQGYTHIVFGDNSSGRIPPVNAEVFVNYRFGVGAAANDLAANALDTIAPIPNEDLYALSVTNPESPVGGSDPESTDSMRYSVARGGARIKDRAVTLADYADLAIQVPGVSKSVAYGTVYTAVHVRIAPPDGKADAAYMLRLCNETEAYLDDKIMVGSSVYAEPLDADELWQDIYVRVLVHVQDAYNRTTVRLQVDSVIRALLTFDSVDFGYRVSIGMIYRATLAVQGVEYAELQWLSTEPPPNELAFPYTDEPVPQISTQTVTSLLGSAQWDYDPTATMANPGTGSVRLNNASTPTGMAISDTDTATNSQTSLFSALRAGDHVVFTQTLNQAQWFSFVITAAPTINTGWAQLGLAVIASSGPDFPETNHDVTVEFIRYAPNPTTPTGDVNDINTNELLIPRIEPTEVIEVETDFPSLDEEERTHDGLWVRAVGGLPNT